MNLPQRRNALQVFWDEVPEDSIDLLIRSMLRRIAECIVLNGAPTYYGILRRKNANFPLKI